MGRHLGRRAVGEAGSRGGANARPRRDDPLPRDVELLAGGRSAAAGCVGAICRRRACQRAADRGVVPAVVRERRTRPAAVAGGGALPLAEGRGVRLVRARHRGEGRALGGEALGAAARAVERPAQGGRPRLPARRDHPLAARDAAATGLLAAVPLRGARAELRRLHADGLLHLPVQDRRRQRGPTRKRMSRSFAPRPATRRSPFTPWAGWPARRRSRRCVLSRPQPRTRAPSARACTTTRRRAPRNGARSALPPEELMRVPSAGWGLLLSQH